MLFWKVPAVIVAALALVAVTALLCRSWDAHYPGRQCSDACGPRGVLRFSVAHGPAGDPLPTPSMCECLPAHP